MRIFIFFTLSAHFTFSSAVHWGHRTSLHLAIASFPLFIKIIAILMEMNWSYLCIFNLTLSFCNWPFAFFWEMYTNVLCPGLNCILWFFLLSWCLSVIWILIPYETYDFRCFLPVIVFFDVQKFLIYENPSLFLLLPVPLGSTSTIFPLLRAL